MICKSYNFCYYCREKENENSGNLDNLLFARIYNNIVVVFVLPSLSSSQPQDNNRGILSLTGGLHHWSNQSLLDLGSVRITTHKK